ncbi:hypothetical protein J437_LFUL001248 [Ladona fulva]|uniref:SH3 domain-containing protein n=1 Tax=Ladona fulva TaxID=123851 RepID=A0A8K0NST6_LADFU|nr:hypothetical protein J437_LFUL001248 [Ladona fulva]
MDDSIFFPLDGSFWMDGLAANGSHEYVRALADYATREPSLLNFKKGDVIKLVNRDQYLQKVHGTKITSCVRIFPDEDFEKDSYASGCFLVL